MVSSELPEGVFLPRVTGRTKVLGVFGFPVEHSQSPAMHNAAIAALGLHYAYIPFLVQPDDIGSAVRSLAPLGIIGVNLTVPHKERVLPFLDELTREAREVGAVNTVHNDRGRLVGFNTDGEGFAGPLAALGFRPVGRKAVVVGAGGAARSVVRRLLIEGAVVTVANRTPQRAERLAAEIGAVAGADVGWLGLDEERRVADAIGGADLLVNTTSVGMTPREHEELPIPHSALHPGLLVYDLVYNPVETGLLSAARRRGACILDGVGMLVHQGAAAFRIWTGVDPPIAVMERAVREGLAAA